LVYATVKKKRVQGKVVEVVRSIVYGTLLSLFIVLFYSKASRKINTSFVERNNGTDRHQNAKKNRKTYRFAKDKCAYDNLSHFVAFSYNFCWAVRTLKVKSENGHWKKRTPAMAAGLTDHIWAVAEWVKHPVIGL
jgi:hypothetical protein